MPGGSILSGDPTLFLSVAGVVEGGTNGGAVLGMLGNVEADVVEFLQGGEHFLALGEIRQLADEHEVADVAAYGGEPRGRAYRLEHHLDESGGDVLLRGIGLRVGEVGGRGVHGQSGQRLGGDVADGEIDVTDIAVLGQLGHLLDITRVEHDARQTFQRAATDADTTDMAHVVAVALHERGTCAHRDDDRMVEFRLKTGTETVGHELLGLRRGQSVDGRVDIGRTYAREHHLLDILQVDVVVMQVLAEGTVKRGDGIGSRNTDRC